MTWTKDYQRKLDRLREKELAGTLTAPERTELGILMAQIEAEEAQTLGPARDRLRAEVAMLEQEVRNVQDENEELGQLLAQQNSLAADARRFLGEFEQRRATILEGLARFAAGPLQTT